MATGGSSYGGLVTSIRAATTRSAAFQAAMPAFVPAFLLERRLPANNLNTSISLTFERAVAEKHKNPQPYPRRYWLKNVSVRCQASLAAASS